MKKLFKDNAIVKSADNKIYESAELVKNLKEKGVRK